MLWFILCASLVALLLGLSASLQGQITDQMRCAWRASLGKVDIYKTDKKIPCGKRGLHPAVFIVLLVIALYPILGWVGYGLRIPLASLQTFVDRITHPYFQIFAIVILITMQWLSDRSIAWFRLKDAYRRFITNIKLRVAPAFFALFFLVGGAAFASHYVFNFRDSFGDVCKPAEKPITLKVCQPDDMKLCKRAPDGSFPATCTSSACRGVELAAFDMASICTPVGVMLERRGQYQFVLEKDGDWRFLGARSGPGGMPLRAFLTDWRDGLTVALGRFTLLAAAYPLKRSLDRPFGRVILRYGETGNEENFIDSEVTNGRLEEQFRASRDGQLFVYLNKPVSGIFTDLLRDVNSGKARIWVYRIPR